MLFHLRLHFLRSHTNPFSYIALEVALFQERLASSASDRAFLKPSLNNSAFEVV